MFIGCRFDAEDFKSLTLGFGEDKGRFITFTTLLTSEFEKNGHLLDKRNLHDNPQGFSVYGKANQAEVVWEVNKIV